MCPRRAALVAGACAVLLVRFVAAQDDDIRRRRSTRARVAAIWANAAKGLGMPTHRLANYVIKRFLQLVEACNALVEREVLSFALLHKECERWLDVCLEIAQTAVFKHFQLMCYGVIGTPSAAARPRDCRSGRQSAAHGWESVYVFPARMRPAVSVWRGGGRRSLSRLCARTGARGHCLWGCRESGDHSRTQRGCGSRVRPGARVDIHSRGAA